MEIERIEEWVGQDVVGSDGEKLGRLEDVFFTSGSRDAQFGAVKSGLMGRHMTLVPLADATVGRDHIKVTSTKDQFKDAPEHKTEDELTPGSAGAVAEHYGVAADAAEYESAQVRSRKEAEAREAAARAEELEKVAAEKGEQADAGEAKAREHEAQAKTAAQEREQALAEAAKAREQAGGSAGDSR